MKLHGFRKTERMVSTTDIEQLFLSGSRSLSVFPVRAVFRLVDSGVEPLMILTSVSKRHFHYAVNRNRAKRQMREAFRLHKEILRTPLIEGGLRMHLALVWISDTPQSSEKVTESIVRLLELIAERL
jgi:ribonuclease P protein component